MSFLFWLLWSIDLILCLLITLGSGFRSSFGASTDLNSWLLIGAMTILIGSLVLRYALKMQTASLVVVALPIIGMGIWYVYDINQ